MSDKPAYLVFDSETVVDGRRTSRPAPPAAGVTPTPA